MCALFNPYDFVRFEKRPSAADEPRLERAQGLSGTLSFQLVTLTPLVINGEPPGTNRRAGHFARLGDTPIIPASSLKGMLRSIHEIVTNSRVEVLSKDDDAPILDKEGRPFRINKHQDAWAMLLRQPGYDPLDADPAITPSERLFGRVRGSGTESVGLAGRVAFDDMRLSPDLVVTSNELAGMLGGPKATHMAFYRTDGADRNSPALGRKLYYHRRNYQPALDAYRRRLNDLIQRAVQRLAQANNEQQRQRAQATLDTRRNSVVTIEWVPAGTNIEGGTLRFRDLTEDELAALVYCLSLEWRNDLKLAHRLGYGKPWGLGSVRFVITGLEVEKVNDQGVPTRFLDYTATVEDWLERVPSLVASVRNAWQHRSNGSYSDFCAILRIDPAHEALYPEYTHFRDNPQLPLDEYQGRPYGALYAGDKFPQVRSESATGGPADPRADKPPIDAPRVDLENTGEAITPSERQRGVLVSQELKGYGVLDANGGFVAINLEPVAKAIKARLKKGQTPRVSFVRIADTVTDIQLDEEPS